MPRNGRKPDPQKNCRACTAPLTRKTFNGRLEDRGVFLRRKFCNRRCMAKSMEGLRVPTAHNSRRQSSKLVKPACERCGSTKRRHVHHVDENPLNNDPSNLQTLCVSCHRLLHSPNWNKTTKQRRSCAHCSAPARRRGLCWTHLTRLKRFGHPLLKKTKRGSTWVLSKVAA